MASTKNFGSVKRFGPRYGRTVRKKIADIEKTAKEIKGCPFCGKKGVKRVFSGVWECRKCDSKFTGKAYDFDRKKMEQSAE